MVKNLRIFSLVVALLFCVRAYGDSIGFEGISDGTNVGSYYAGVTFTNAVVLTSGISLNELEFPPHSGQNVASDSGGPIGIAFAAPVSSFSAYFTYAEPLLLSAYGSGGTFLGTVTSSYPANYTSSGNPPNELLSLSFSQSIYSLSLAGDPVGGSFVLDDISYTPATSPPPPPPPPPPPSTVPEPPGLLLLSTGLLLLLLRSRGFLQVVKVHAISRP